MNREDFKRALNESRIPDYMRGGMERYILQGVRPGGFMSALLSNDLRRTFERADENNQRAVLDYLKFLYNGAPAQAWGSEAKFEKWIEVGGWEGMDEGRLAE
jgi:hypothetical protein